MEFTYENQGGSTLLVWKLPVDVEIDEMIKGMMENNEIKGLLPFVFVQNDMERYAKYNVSSKVTLRQYFSGMIKKKVFISVVLGIVNTVLETENYMIAQENLLFNVDYIYVDISTGQTEMVVLPVVQRGAAWDLGQFFRSLLLNVQFDTRENGNYVTEILNFLNSGASFSIVEFKKLLDKHGKEEVPAVPASSQSVQIQSVERQKVSQPARRGQITDEPMSSAQKPKQQTKGMQISGGSVTSAQKPEYQVGGMQIPGPSSKDNQTKTDGQEKAISMFYLLQHYNKETAAAYKAQKEAKKEAKNQAKKLGKSGGMTSSDSSGKTGKQKKEKKKDIPQIGGFSIPGQEPEGFPVSESAGFPKQQEIFEGFGDTCYFPDDNEDTEVTEMMGMEGEARRVMPYLIRKKNGERIPVNREIFHLGRDVSYNDYPIVDNKYVGHSHCHIITRNGEYFIVDDNSKNHTYVDEVLAMAGVEVKISHGQKIRLASEEFEFRLF